MDSLFAVEVGEGVLREVRVALELVHGGRDRAVFEEVGELRVGEVADANSLDFAGFHKGFHRGVGFEVRDGGVIGDGISAFGFRHGVVTTGEGVGPVHQVEIEIVGGEVFQGGIAGGGDV